MNLRNRLHIYLSTIVIAILLVQCAKRGTPSGGPIDESAPVVVGASPENYTTGFKNQKIEITFDEYIKLQDLQQQLVISPPLEYRPVITPQGGVSKKLTIEITDTLQDNTTYVLNFGQSIIDNTEGNAYPFYKYVFSTGTYIDSLEISGRIYDALNFEADDYVSVMLYEVNEQYTDSIIYTSTPRYVINTLDSLTSFTMENLKPGNYRMIGLKENSTNLKFDPESDKLGFVSDVVTVPSDKMYDIQMYDPVSEQRLGRAKQVGSSSIQIGYYGNLDSLKIDAIDNPRITDSRITKLDMQDTLIYWYKPVVEQDSMILNTYYGDFRETIMAALKDDVAKDSLIITNYGQFSLSKALQLTATTPIAQLDPSRMRLINKDSIAQNFSLELDSLKNVLTYNFDRQEEERYTLQLLPEAITDFYGAVNDTISKIYTTRSITDLGNIPVILENGSSWPVIIEIVKENLDVVSTKIATGNGSYDFEYLDPGNYYIRVIYDRNKNGRYDPGNWLLQQQPERVDYYPSMIPLQANWDYVTTISLE